MFVTKTIQLFIAKGFTHCLKHWRQLVGKMEKALVTVILNPDGSKAKVGELSTEWYVSAAVRSRAYGNNNENFAHSLTFVRERSKQGSSYKLCQFHQHIFAADKRCGKKWDKLRLRLSTKWQNYSQFWVIYGVKLSRVRARVNSEKSEFFTGNTRVITKVKTLIFSTFGITRNIPSFGLAPMIVEWWKTSNLLVTTRR